MVINHSHSKTVTLRADVQGDLVRATHILQQGGIVALPTETVYGLAGNGLDQAIIEKIFHAKMRPANNPLILHAKNADDALSMLALKKENRTYARARALADRFWPGPLTIIAKKVSGIPDAACAGLETVAVRVPDHEAAQSILQNLSFPLVMPSANLSTRPSPTCAEHVLKTLDGRIDAVLDGGSCSVGIESTVVHIESDVVQILRPGHVTARDIEDCLHEYVENAQHSVEKNKPLSPGQSYLHYSPAIAHVRMVSEPREEHWRSDDIILARRGDFVSLEEKFGLRDNNIILSDEPKDFAHELYGALYYCEQFPDKTLWIIMPSSSDHEWNGIVDRLTRSARN